MCQDASIHEEHRPRSVATAERITACASAGTFAACPRRFEVQREADGTERWVCPLQVWSEAILAAGAAVKHRDLIVADRLGLKALSRDPAVPEDVPIIIADALRARQPVKVWSDRDLTNRREFPGREIEITTHENLLALGGSRGIGKSLALAYLVAYCGGRIVDAYPFARPGVDVESLIAERGPVVIDQLGREYARSDWALVQIEEVLERRRKLGRLTVLLANLNRADFAARYGKFIDDRLNEDAAFVVCYGKSRRGQP